MRPFTPPKIPQVSSFPPPNPEEAGSFPPPNPDEGRAYHRIKSKLRGGMDAGKGYSPYYQESDPTPPYGIPRPKQ